VKWLARGLDRFARRKFQNGWCFSFATIDGWSESRVFAQ